MVILFSSPLPQNQLQLQVERCNNILKQQNCPLVTAFKRIFLKITVWRKTSKDWRKLNPAILKSPQQRRSESLSQHINGYVKADAHVCVLCSRREHMELHGETRDETYKKVFRRTGGHNVTIENSYSKKERGGLKHSVDLCVHNEVVRILLLHFGFCTLRSLDLLSWLLPFLLRR